MKQRAFSESAGPAMVGVVLLLSAGIALAQESPAQTGQLQLCTQQYEPVCAVKDGAARTYSNACLARAAGARIIARGRCKHELRGVPPDKRMRY